VTDIKFVCLFLTVLLLCSCPVQKKSTQPPAGHAEDTLPAIPETARETTLANAANASGNSNPYTFRFSNGTYHDMNDLTYFLADTSIKSLRLYGGRFHDLSPLAELSELEELEITSNSYITDISPIGSLINLKKLTLNNGDYEGSIEAISALVNLKELFLSCSSRYYRELVPLQKLEILEILNASREGLDFTYIAQLYSLKHLGVTVQSDSPEGMANIGQLKNLVNLQTLYFGYYGRNIDISWIPNLQSLSRFSAENCIIDDITPLQELPNLVDVELWNMTVKNITSFLESKSIKKILLAYPVNEDEINMNELYRLFKERGIEYTQYYHDR
jgi:internalin A